MSEFPSVDHDTCVGCQTCMNTCPKGDALWEFNDEGKAVFKIDNKDECVHCHACGDSCPASAISFKEQ
ncbi:putative [4Fe-4S]ferredoxin [Monocercomonoides exilis]|uniref:putative [4Fe-4S]ferredoxin n=1 Tax=Monocercomonoides exilis TaxID=2049356 RepID=UPI00355ABCC1|nr:putative [4Fe-4S]ferredoxin [Monocercomonoides exilis]|eukprot:MONOS_6059.1-p1 / transcript=MONOS_6059.1 / gene=MONOS_6059 / organism=Monocercomonoides_exilis_PA203 / gene_product=[4Fe-4S]ferredoxin / transcript_product=[4Fe-4S]ferredoxin / location=Mono_scaffold00186:1700-2033(+) / protein_length=68 / sequence_SO=supercontig / SO=protein_coding / is_pseudo=false